MQSILPETIPLHDLQNGIPALTKAKASMLMECCVWCFVECGHDNGVTLMTRDNCGETPYLVRWLSAHVDRDGICRAYNREDAVEFGAEAISFLLVRKRTPFTAIQRSATGTGIDYWLGYKPIDPNLIFSKRDARLEVSGILRETSTNTIQRRIKDKLNQTGPSDHTFPVYVIVVEFSQPRAEMVMKNDNGD